MHTKLIEYYDGPQKLIGRVIYNDEPVSYYPAIIIFPAFEGPGEFSVTYAQKLAEHGFLVFIADMYGDAKVGYTLPDCINLILPFLGDRALVRKRALLALDALVQQNPNVAKNKVAAIGFCFGGMCVLELARSGAHIKAAAAIHGVLAQSNLPTHPLKAKLLVIHGYQDPQVPPNALSAFAQEMASVNYHDWIFTFLGDAQHSFTDPRTGTYDPIQEVNMGRVYNKLAAERTYRYLVDFLKEQLLS